MGLGRWDEEGAPAVDSTTDPLGAASRAWVAQTVGFDAQRSVLCLALLHSTAQLSQDLPSPGHTAWRHPRWCNLLQNLLSGCTLQLRQLGALHCWVCCAKHRAGHSAIVRHGPLVQTYGNHNTAQRISRWRQLLQT